MKCLHFFKEWLKNTLFIDLALLSGHGTQYDQDFFNKT